MADLHAGWRLSALFAVPVAATSVFAGYAIASASAATTGTQFVGSITMNNGLSYNACAETAIIETIYGDAFGIGTTSAFVQSGTSCGTYKNAPAGYLGAAEWTTMNGSVCASEYRTSSSESASFQAATFCSNPSGTQLWYALSQSSWYKGSYCQSDCGSNGYFYTNMRWSPNATF